MWLAAICQAIVDASSRGAMPHEQLVRAEARRWLTEPSAGLHAVLDAVDVERDGGTATRLRSCWVPGGRQCYARRRRPRTRTVAT